MSMIPETPPISPLTIISPSSQNSQSPFTSRISVVGEIQRSNKKYCQRPVRVIFPSWRQPMTKIVTGGSHLFERSRGPLAFRTHDLGSGDVPESITNEP